MKPNALNPLVLIFIIILFAAILTYMIPAGSFERVPVEGEEYEVVIPDTFSFIEQQPIGIFDFFVTFSKSLQSVSDIFFFMLIIGAVFQLLDYTNILNKGMSAIILAFRGHEIMIIPFSVLIFSFLSATAACCEEYLALVPVMYLLCTSLGLDGLTAVALLFVSSAVGYAGGMMNAFTVGIAQKISGLTIFSGMQLRWILWIVLNICTSGFLILHGIRVKNNAGKGSQLNREMGESTGSNTSTTYTPLNVIEYLSLGIFFGAFIVIGITVMKFGFYIDEMSAIFIIVFLIIGFINKLTPSIMAEQFIEGAKNMLWAAITIGLCKVATDILQNAGIIDTIIWAIGNVLLRLPTTVSAIVMFLFQDLLNIIIHSGPGQATITMPFMAPLSDIIGINRQVSVLAFQMGDAFTNAIAPTGGELMAAIAMCHVPYKNWFKFMLPLWLIWIIIASIFMTIAVLTGYH